MSKAPAQLRVELDRNRDLAARINAPDFDRDLNWRVVEGDRRLYEGFDLLHLPGHTPGLLGVLLHADLYHQHRYERACRFFLDELYGGLDFRKRDAQLERVAPIMARLLSDDMLAAVDGAMGLQADSLELDIDLAGHLGDTDPITQPAYAEAYRRQGRWDDRIEQIHTIGRLGRTLDRVVHRSSILRLVRMVRMPARAAGFGALQDFLEAGLRSFRELNGAEDFIEIIETREMQALEAMREGSDWPFAAWIGEGPA